MIYNNLNRVKGILSARQGAEIPKYTGGAKFKLPYKGSTLYSIDRESWFTDEACRNPFTMTETDEFRQALSQIQYMPQDVDLSMKIPGGLEQTPYTAVEDAARHNEISRQVVEETIAERRAAAIPLPEVNVVAKSPNNASTVSPLNVQPLSEKLTPEEISAGISTVKEKSEEYLKQKQKELGKYNKKINTATSMGQIASAGIQTIGGALGAHQSASDSNTTKNITAAWDGAANIASQFGPVGEAVGTVMGLAKGAGDIIQSITGDTDQITKTDQWMSSPLLSWNVGIVNDWFAKKSDSLGVDQSTLATVGSSYGGSTNDILEMSKKANKKIGLLAGKERTQINADIANARASQAKMRGIADTATDQRLAVQSMGEQAGLAYSIMTDGGYSQKYTYAAKHGGLLEWNPVETLEWEPQIELNWELPKFKAGGNVDIVEELEWIPEFKSGNKIRTIEELIEYAKKKNPRFIQRLSEEPRGIKFTDDEGKDAEGSHYLESRGEYVIPRIQEINGELKFLSPQEAIDRAMESGNYLEMSPEEAIIFAEQYKQGWPEFFKKFKKGGSVGDSDIPETEETAQKNVIPEGALHKNKHHMEHAEGLTKKGIPVVDTDGEQQAEIEHSEIIFTLEVTKKLEEYYEIFYSEESTNKEKEQAALDAGKLLVYQILENTEDRTGLIESCKKGGTLTFKKDTEELIEEVLEWMPTVIIVEESKEEKPEKKEDKLKANKEQSEKDIMKEAIKEVLIELLIK